MREVARVLRPGGRWVFSVTHPLRWVFPDDPGEAGLVAGHSYFDRTPYVEQGPDGAATYVEHHRTIGDRVREITAAGLRLVDLVEPEWPAGNDRTWGGVEPAARPAGARHGDLRLHQDWRPDRSCAKVARAGRSAVCVRSGEAAPDEGRGSGAERRARAAPTRPRPTLPRALVADRLRS